MLVEMEFLMASRSTQACGESARLRWGRSVRPCSGLEMRVSPPAFISFVTNRNCRTHVPRIVFVAILQSKAAAAAAADAAPASGGLFGWGRASSS